MGRNPTPATNHKRCSPLKCEGGGGLGSGDVLLVPNNFVNDMIIITCCKTALSKVVITKLNVMKMNELYKK